MHTGGGSFLCTSSTFSTLYYHSVHTVLKKVQSGNQADKKVQSNNKSNEEVHSKNCKKVLKQISLELEKVIVEKHECSIHMTDLAL